jgi:cholesterol oxidase
VAANLGVNPSLTITALAERAMSFIPLVEDTDWNDEAWSDNAWNDAA